MPMKFSEDVATDNFMYGLCIHLASFVMEFFYTYVVVAINIYALKCIWKHTNI